MRATVLSHLIWPLLALTGLIAAADTCLHSETSVNVVITVFEDLNANGKLDRGEEPIPDVPFRYSLGYQLPGSRFTDAQGQATVSSRFRSGPPSSVYVITPCGYRPTTETTFNPVGESRIEIGFAPVSPRSGIATIRFHVWEDRDRDGRQSDDEFALSSFTVCGSFVCSTTDSDGWTTFNLGNTCGSLVVSEPGDWVTTVITPGGWRAGELVVLYDLGTTEVEWGVRKPWTLTPTVGQ